MYWKIRKFVHLKQCFGKNFVEISLSIGGIQFDPDYAISRKIQRQSYWLLHRGTIFGKFPTLQQPIGLPLDFPTDGVIWIKLDPAYRQRNFDKIFSKTLF